MGVAANIVSDNALIDAYAKKGGIEGAESALARMEEMGVGPTRAPPPMAAPSLAA